MEQKKIAIVGCGSIGSALAEYAKSDLSEFISDIILRDSDSCKLDALLEKVSGMTAARSIGDAIDKADLVIEAAAPAVAEDVLKSAVEKGKDVMIMSIGGVLGNEDLLDEASEKGVKVLMPSGAISGVDSLKASKIAGLESVTLTTRKAPGSIEGAPYLVENNIDVHAIREETIVFEGNVTGAIKGFPKNVNVSALLSLAGVGPRETKVKIVVSPEYTKNSHEIEIKSKAGTIYTRTENVPSPDNPKTSYLAALAAMTALKGYFSSVRIGT